MKEILYPLYISAGLIIFLTTCYLVNPPTPMPAPDCNLQNREVTAQADFTTTQRYAWQEGYTQAYTDIIAAIGIISNNPERLARDPERK